MPLFLVMMKDLFKRTSRVIIPFIRIWINSFHCIVVGAEDEIETEMSLSRHYIDEYLIRSVGNNLTISSALV
jgi:hypothetical protein